MPLLELPTGWSDKKRVPNPGSFPNNSSLCEVDKRLIIIASV